MPPKLAAVFNSPTQATPLVQLPETPNTRKRQQNYYNLHNFGLQGSSQALSSQTEPTAKRSRLNPVISLSPIEELIDVTPAENPPSSPSPIPLVRRITKKNEAIQKYAWWWKYFDVKKLERMFSKGKKGHKQEQVHDELYTCNLRGNCQFHRYASKLHTSVSALKDHIINIHNIREETDETFARIENPTILQGWLETNDNPESFEQALLDWIVYDCQPFTVTESKWFKRMLRIGGCDLKIPGADTVKNRLTARVKDVEEKNTILFAEKSSTVAVSLDGWTSQNNYSVIAINVSCLGPKFEVIKRCIEFIEIEGSHSGENLAKIVGEALQKHGLLQKLLSITADNASNNNTLCRYLYSFMKRQFDDHLEEFPSKEGTMRFKGEASQIRCFAHILNLVVKVILKDLGSSTYKDASDLLDRATEHLAKKRWLKITIPGATGVIAKLRIVVLWIGRSAQRQQDWDRRSKKQINYDVDTRWNSTLRMIQDALNSRAILNDFIADHPELIDLTLSKNDWSQLEIIRDLLLPFGEYTEFVSREEPTLQMSARMYIELEGLLTKASKKRDEYCYLDQDLVHAVEAGLQLFKEYLGFMKNNDIYFLATILDPRIKTKWIKDHIDDADEVITRLRQFLKNTYSHEVELPSADDDTLYKSLEYRFLKPYATDTSMDDEHDIDRYLDSPRIKHKPKAKEDQTQWILNWWEANMSEYPCTAQAARDYLAIPASEVDIERLFSLGRDILGIRRFSMSISTLRTLILLKDALNETEKLKLTTGKQKLK
jgi:hypothetical protein